MNERFIKYIPSEKLSWLRRNYTNAFLLLSVISERARRDPGKPDGLQIGDAIIGRREASIEAGITENQYRKALEKLVEFNIVKIITNGKKFIDERKITIRITNKSTIVNLVDNSLWDINPERQYITNHQQNHQLITNRAPTDHHKQEGIRRNKKEEINHPQTPSFAERQKSKPDLMDDDLMIDFFEIRILKKDLIELKELVDEVDLRKCIDELKEKFSGKNVNSWGALIKHHISKNSHKFVRKNLEINCQTSTDFYKKCKKNIDKRGKFYQSEDGKDAVLESEGKQEKIPLADIPRVFSQRLESSLRKFGMWVTKEEKIIPIDEQECL